MPRSSRFSGRCFPSLTVTLFFILTLAVTVTCSAQTFVSFDGPLAGNQSGGLFTAGTFPVAINRWGCIGLVTVDNNGITHAFVREPNGKYRTVHPPKATQTFLAGMNGSGQVAGAFQDSGFHEHGYVKNTDGTYTVLDPPGATGLTTVVGINDAGQVAGNAYIGGTRMPFFWDPAHPNTYVVLTIPGSTGTGAVAINAGGQIAGIYFDSSSQEHGFLRNADGTIASFEIAGASQMYVTAMNKWGTITGNSFNQGVTSGFLRYSGGGQKSYGSCSHCGPQPTAINNKGVVVGYFFSEGGGNSAFSMDRSLTTTGIPVPFSNTSTAASGINDVGQIVGTYIDSNGASHGWLELP
jgi:hypothetical protein